MRGDKGDCVGGMLSQLAVWWKLKPLFVVRLLMPVDCLGVARHTRRMRNMGLPIRSVVCANYDSTICHSEAMLLLLLLLLQCSPSINQSLSTANARHLPHAACLMPLATCHLSARVNKIANASLYAHNKRL